MLGHERSEHVQIVEVAKVLTKIVQGFRLRLQRFRPRAGQQRELVAQIDDAGAKGMQRNRVFAVEGEAPALARLPVGARDSFDDVLRPDSAQVPSLDAPDDRA